LNLFLGAIVLAAIAAGWVVYPLVMQRWGLLGDTYSGHAVDRETRKRVALAALKEVEYDRASGKLDENDYRELKSRLEREALDVLRPQEGDGGTTPAASIRHHCGFMNPAGSRFCAGCGKRLS